jgi:predicted Rossmann fold nucleotide-binding protein DprA/Smf involved in DNA uptake
MIELNRTKTGYPAALVERMGKDAPAAVWVLGNAELLHGDLLGLFCSVKCPGNEILKLYDLARGLRDSNVGVVSGFHTPMERECLVTLLRGSQPIMICPARSLHRMRVPQEWRAGIDAGRLALVASFPATISRASRETAAVRNQLVAALASKVVIAYAEPGGQTNKVAEELANAGRPPLNLDAEELRQFRPS